MNDFMRLSAVINYQISAKHIDWNNVINIILSRRTISDESKNILHLLLEYSSEAYGKKKRRLGPLAILHPLRATALLARVADEPDLLNLMTILLHDNFEDIKPKRVEIDMWIRKEKKFQKVLQMITETDRWFLIERLKWLTKEPTETYYRYIGRLIKHSGKTPEVIRVKLADRLDNTLDMRIEYEDPLQKVDFFEILFQMLYSNIYTGFEPEFPHPPPATLNGVQRLYQLFKNTVLMSLIRQKQAAKDDEKAQTIFYHLARASMREAQRIALHIFSYHERDIKIARELLLDTMNYVRGGGIDMVTPRVANQKLDGLFVSTFDEVNKKRREKKLAELYTDKHLMVQAAVAFIVMFLNFINDPEYYVKGITEEGVHPEPQNY